MASRQLSQDITENSGGLRLLGNRLLVQTGMAWKAAWAIVFICACIARCGPGPSSPTSGTFRIYDLWVARYSINYNRTYRGGLATDGSHHRITFYWLNPIWQLEPMDLLVFSDFLVYPDRIVYWYHSGGATPHTLAFGGPETGQPAQLPKDNTLESMLQLVFGLVARIHGSAGQGEGPIQPHSGGPTVCGPCQGR
jgi:hypothetical protein